MVKAAEPVTRLGQIRSVGVIGDPGCEGLGTCNMKVYAGALEKSGKDDITLIAGDLVQGEEFEYEHQFCREDDLCLSVLRLCHGVRCRFGVLPDLRRSEETV